MKICTKCKINKALDEYSIDNRHKDGRCSACKSCHNNENKKYNAEHKQQVAERNKNHRTEHKQEIAEYRANHKQKMAEYQNGYRTKNKQNLAEGQEKYRKSNKGKAAIRKYDKSEKGIACAARRNANRHSNEKRTEITLTAKEFSYIIFLQNYQCIGPNCESGIFFDNVKPQRDHINPVTKGGDFTKENVQALCQSCNSKKSIQYIDYRTKTHKDFILRL